MVHVHFDMSALRDNVDDILDKKVDTLYYDRVKNDAAGLYAQYIAKYVPYKTGRLLHSAKVNNGAVTYSARVRRPGYTYDYADIQYETPFPPESRSTPGTYDHWNTHLTRAERESFYHDVANLIVEEMNNG